MTKPLKFPVTRHPGCSQAGFPACAASKSWDPVIRQGGRRPGDGGKKLEVRILRDCSCSQAQQIPPAPLCKGGKGGPEFLGPPFGKGGRGGICRGRILEAVKTEVERSMTDGIPAFSGSRKCRVGVARMTTKKTRISAELKWIGVWMGALFLTAASPRADDGLHFGAPFASTGNFAHPFGLGVDNAHGRLLVADTDNHLFNGRTSPRPRRRSIRLMVIWLTGTRPARSRGPRPLRPTPPARCMW